jgi:regulator of cell morphogenesis and NO signaling
VSTTVTRDRVSLAGCPIADAITGPGKELSLDDTVAAARALFANDRVRVLPVLDGTTYLGAVDRGSIRDASDGAAAASVATALLPTTLATTPAEEALAALDRHGSNRLVVLDSDRATYVGLVCLRSDRVRLCVDAAFFDGADPSTERNPAMSTIATDAHVADLVLEQPSRARVFERFEINYCCGGKTPLETACAERGLDLEVVVAALEQSRTGGTEDIDWRAAPVTDLCAHIVDHHHAYLHDELPALRRLVDKVASSHGKAHPELAEVETAFAALADELEEHMAAEEQILFPACVALEEGDPFDFPFGSVENPIRAMRHEHDAVAAELARLRELTNGYEPPRDACNSYRSMLDRLETLETDTHRHVHEENNVLFPRAVALESALPSPG